MISASDTPIEEIRRFYSLRGYDPHSSLFAADLQKMLTALHLELIASDELQSLRRDAEAYRKQQERENG